MAMSNVLYPDDFTDQVQQAQAIQRERSPLLGAEPEHETATRLKSYIERIERLNTEVTEIKEQVRDVFAEADSFGFYVPALRRIMALKRMDADKRMELEGHTETYKGYFGI